MSKSIHFFETQFQKQVAESAHTLNPFELLALDHVRGRLLDFGCGLGNLAIAAARKQCTVLALDAAPTAVLHVQSVAAREGLPIEARQADLRSHVLEEDFDTVAAIGLLMFFERDVALRQLTHIKSCVRPGGVAIINVLIEGTTYLDMFDASGYYLFRSSELREAFAGWEIVHESFDQFPAPNGTTKSFTTVVARKPENSA
jgi:tellurite methyltransferase